MISYFHDRFASSVCNNNIYATWLIPSLLISICFVVLNNEFIIEKVVNIELAHTHTHRHWHIRNRPHRHCYCYCYCWCWWCWCCCWCWNCMRLNRNSEREIEKLLLKRQEKWGSWLSKKGYKWKNRTHTNTFVTDQKFVTLEPFFFFFFLWYPKTIYMRFPVERFHSSFCIFQCVTHRKCKRMNKNTLPFNQFCQSIIWRFIFLLSVCRRNANDIRCIYLIFFLFFCAWHQFVTKFARTIQFC